VQSFSPRAKILLYLLLVIAVFISSSYKVSLFLLCCALISASKVPLKALKRGALPIVLFLTFTFVSNILFQEGAIQYRILGLSVTEEGLMRGGQLTLRLVILIIGAKALTGTTKAEDLVSGMSRLLGPVGRFAFVKELLFTMSLTLRLLPIVYDEALELYRNVKNSEGTNISGKIKLSVSLITPLFERSLKKAKEMSDGGEQV
jgi:energy-coupling factor transport system permease protein